MIKSIMFNSPTDLIIGGRLLEAVQDDPVDLEDDPKVDLDKLAWIAACGAQRLLHHAMH